MSKGEPPGRWLFPFRNDLGVSGEIHAEGVSGEQFRTVLNHLCHPVHLTQLGRAPQKFATTEEKVEKYKRKHPDATEEQIAEARVRFESRHAHAVHAWDLTFSVVKSISVAHAALEHEAHRLEAEAEAMALEIEGDEGETGGQEGMVALLQADAAARRAEAAEVVASFRAGIDAAMAMAGEEFGKTRRGAAGPDIDGKTTMRHVRERNLQSAIFVHHTSRERDPQLHAHVMVLNRLLCEDEQWRALFASGLLKSKHQLDAVFTRVMEAELTRRLGWRFAMRPDGKAREVVGVSPEIRDLFSARSRALSEKAQELIDKYVAIHGEPSAMVRWRLQQQATIESRKAKPKAEDTPTREQDVERWDKAVAKEFHEGFTGVIEEMDVASRTPPGDSDFDPEVVKAQALADITDRKGTFNRSHLMFAISQFLPDMPGLDADAVVALLRKLTEEALSGDQVVNLAAPALINYPASLIDPQTGESVFEAPHGGRFTTRTHLSREDWLVDLLRRRGAPRLSRGTADEAVAGRGLSEEQARVAIDVFTADWFVEIVEAGAGTGKSRLMAVTSEVSNDIWGQGLTGFTASQNAAEVLAREGVHRAHNIAAFLTYRRREKLGEATDVDRAKFAVPERSTVVVDESSMVSTPQAVALIEELIELNVGRVVLIGDTAQVDAVDAGGGFKLLVDAAAQRERDGDPDGPGTGGVHTLTTVRRFANEWERDASARLRDGDITALTDYAKRGRIAGEAAEPEEVERKAVQAFVDDAMTGAETVLVVGDGDTAARLSSQIRTRLVAAGRVSPDGVALHDRTIAGVGDLIQTRMNQRNPDVVNREVWRVDAIDMLAGTMRVSRSERDQDGRRVWGATRDLPANYVRDYVELAYAATVQAVQGRTTDTGHLLIDETMGRSRAYPGVTRGRDRNTMWVPIERPARRHRESDEDYEARIPTALSAVVAAFEREDHTDAARTIIAAEQARATNLGHLGPQWQQLITEHREGVHRQMLREVVGTDREALFADDGVEGVLHLMRSAESHGYDVRAELTAAYGTHRIANARTPAGMLYGLLDRHLRREDVVPSVKVERAETYEARVPAGDGEIDVARQAGRLMDAREQVLGEEAEVDPPAWAQALLGVTPEDPFQRGVWREKVGAVAAFREQYGWRSEVDPMGPAPSRAEPEKRWAWLRGVRALGEETERDVVTATDGELANRVLKWRREQENMPRNVDEDLRTANEDANEARGQIVAARTRGEDPSAWVKVLADMEGRAKRLDRVDGARQAAVRHTVEPRDRAQEALVEMRRRVERDRVVAVRAEAKRAADERDRREAEDRDAAVHAAVGERFRAQWVPDAPAFGSQRWAELDDEPQRRASLFNAALSWWRMNNPRDERALTDRLADRGVDVAPDHALPERALERIRGGEDEERVRRDYPTGDLRVLGEVHRYTSRDMDGDAPVFGTPDYAAADDDRKTRAETRAALAFHHAGDTLAERERRAEVEEERQAASAMSERVKAERDGRVDRRTHREIAAARGEETAERDPVVVEPPEPKQEERTPARPDTSWVREAARAAERERPAEAEREPEPEREPESPRESPEPAAARDDLDEQLVRARDTEERIRVETESRNNERREQERRATERREPERTRESEDMQR